MRTIYPVVLVIAFAIAGLMLQMSGFNAIFTGDIGTTGEAIDAVEGQANDSSVANGSEFKSSARSEGDVIGFVISGAATIYSVGQLVILLPLEMQQMGFPRWFAYPLGLSIQLIVSVGVIQFTTGRIWR